MARSVGFDVTVGDNGATTTPVRAATALERLANRLDEAGKQAAKATAEMRPAAAAVDDLGDEADQAARRVDNLGDQMGQTAAEGGRLAAAIEMTKARHADLLQQLDRTGNTDLIPQIKDEGGLLRTLTRMRGELTGMAGDAEKAGKAIGEEATRGLGQALTDGMERLPGMLGSITATLGPTGTAIGAAIVASALPAIGAGLSGAGLGALAAAGIAAGIAGAATDGRVVGAAQAVGATLKNELSIAGQQFVEPIVWSLRRVGQAAGSLGLSQALAPLAAVIRPVTDDLVQMAERAMPGIKAAVAAAAPLILQVASELPELGESVGDFAESLAEAGPGAAKFFSLLIQWLGPAIELQGDLLSGLSKIFDMFATFGEKIHLFNFGDDADAEKISDFGTAGSAALDALTGSAAAATTQLQTLTQAVDEMSGVHISAIQAESAYQAAIDAATESYRQHGATLDLDTDAGRRNMDTLIQVAKATEAQAQAVYNETAATQGSAAAADAAAAVYDRGRNQLVALAMQYGMDEAKAREFANAVNAVPNFKNLTVSVDISEAMDRIRRVADAMGAIRASWGSFGGGGAAMVYGSFGAFNAKAAGGPIIGPGTETSDSIPTMMSTGEHVWTAAEVRGAGGHQAVTAMRHAALAGGGTRAMLAAAPTSTSTSAAGGGVTRATVLESDGSAFGDWVVEIVRRAVERAGGSAQFALGRAGVA